MVFLVSRYIPKIRQIRLPYKMNYIFIRDGFLSERGAIGDSHSFPSLKVHTQKLWQTRLPYTMNYTFITDGFLFEGD